MSTGYKYPDPVVGSRYTGWVDAAEVAKRVRADIKQAKADGTLPKHVKTSVRCRKYAGGQAVDVTLSGWTTSDVWTTTPDGYSTQTADASQVLVAVEKMRSAYNRNASDPMTDYYDVTYYGTTQWDVRPWSA